MPGPRKKSEVSTSFCSGFFALSYLKINRNSFITDAQVEGGEEGVSSASQRSIGKKSSGLTAAVSPPLGVDIS